jgi:hypothetical protein
MFMARTLSEVLSVVFFSQENGIKQNCHCATRFDVMTLDHCTWAREPVGYV